MKHNTGRLNNKSEYYRGHYKVLLSGYVILVALYFYLARQCHIDFGMFGILLLCLVNLLGALHKSQVISLSCIDNRAKKEELSFSFEKDEEIPLMIFPTILCFVNYTVFSLTLIVCGELFDEGLRNSLWSENGWMIIAYIVLGLVAFFYGNCLEKNSSDLFDTEPARLAKEEAAKNRKKQEDDQNERIGISTRNTTNGGINGFDAKKSSILTDIGWLLFAIVFACLIAYTNFKNDVSKEKEEFYEELYRDGYEEEYREPW